MDTYYSIFTLLIFTLFSAYFSASETALFSLSPIKLKAFQSNPDPRKQLIAKLVMQPRDLLVTVFMLNTLVNILLQNVASDMFGEDARWELTIGVPLGLTLIFGEIIPKYFAIQNNVSFSYLVIPSINFFQNILKPVRKLIIYLTLPISRAMFFFLKKEDSISKEELEHVLKKSEEQGVLPPEEAELVWGYLHLQDTTVKELMRPREDLIYYDIQEPFSKLSYLFVDMQCSRLPVCDSGLQNVLGIITAKQYFIHRLLLKKPSDLAPFLSKPFYVPEMTLANVLLKRLDEKEQEIALVVNEYGFITGLIAYEDLVEVVVGNISDFRDQRLLYTKAGQDEIIANGKLELSELNEVFDADLKSSASMVTIGGWLTEQYGDIPKSGTKMEFNGFLFQVLAADPTRIQRVYVRKIKPNKDKGK